MMHVIHIYDWAMRDAYKNSPKNQKSKKKQKKIQNAPI